LILATNIVDLLIGLLLIMAIPALTAIYLKGAGAPRSLIVKVCALGILWIVFSLVSEELLEAISTFERADSYAHEAMAERLLLGKEPNFFDEIPTGNRAYQAFVYGLFAAGAYVPSARAINAFCGFWGGLVLARYLKDYVAWEKHGQWMLLAVIFLPSTVFWTSGNMKEGLTYWGICMMYSAALGTGKRTNVITPSLIAGAIVCGFMRPHMAFAWLIAIGSVTLLSSGRRVYALLCLAALPLLFAKMQTMAQNDFSSLDKTLTMLEGHSEGLRRMGGAVQSGDSIPVISGLLAIFFRPFLWESRSFFMTICAVEIWTITLTMLRAWWKATSEERRFLWRTPAIRVALFAVLITSVLFSYLPNDGLLARQRVQIVPALMILAILPLGIRSFLRNTRRIANARAAFGRHPTTFGPPGFPPGAQFPVDSKQFLGTPSNRGAPR
jgi:hypothetical protein